MVAKEDIALDFFSFHVYNLARKPNIEVRTDIKESEKAIESVTAFRTIMLGDEQNLTNSIDSVVEMTRELHKGSKEIWITEWNGNSDSQDLLHDTCYMAAFITKYAIENFEKVNGMGFWTFTDLFEEFKQKQCLFHGGFGLKTINGIKKASYHAFYFLSKLGNELIVKRENMIVTKKGEDYQILLFNYSHPNYLYRTFDYSQLSLTSRYTVMRHYYQADVHHIGDEEFHQLLGYTPPNPLLDRKKKLGYNDTIAQGRHKKGLGKFLYLIVLIAKKVLFLLGKPLQANNVMFVMNMPFRQLPRFTQGKISEKMIDRMLKLINLW